MSQIVDFPTHVSGSVLDLVLTSYPNLIKSVEEAGYLGKSDHKALYIDVVLNPECKESSKTIDDWRKADFANMKKELSDVNWNAATESCTTEEYWNLIKSCIHNAKDKYVPKKVINAQKKPPWLTKEISLLQKQKNRKWKKYKRSNLEDDFRSYKEVDKLLKKRTKNAKKNFERKRRNY
jgi:hypothetical protein